MFNVADTEKHVQYDQLIISERSYQVVLPKLREMEGYVDCYCVTNGGASAQSIEGQSLIGTEAPAQYLDRTKVYIILPLLCLRMFYLKLK